MIKIIKIILPRTVRQTKTEASLKSGLSVWLLVFTATSINSQDTGGFGKMSPQVSNFIRYVDERSMQMISMHKNNSEMKCFIKVKFIIIVVFGFYLLLESCTNRQNESQVQDSKCEQMEYMINNTLSSKDYSTFEGFVPKDGFIPSAEIAVQVAERILKHIYGKEQIEQQKPFLVNLENNIWIIEGYWGNDCADGGNVYMELSKEDGRVLKVVHTK